MNTLLRVFLVTPAAFFRARRDLALENLAQLAVLQRSTKRPRISRTDVVLSRIWPRWSEALMLVEPATVVAWHRKGFRLYWTWKSRKRVGRPSIPSELRELIRKMSTANPLWGAPRVPPGRHACLCGEQQRGRAVGDRHYHECCCDQRLDWTAARTRRSAPERYDHLRDEQL